MSYPRHEFSHFIDPETSFSNKVKYPSKATLVDGLKNMRCDGGIMLEPRLQEYIKKKKFYRDNNIKPCVSLESEFQIVDRDKKLLRAFLTGRRDMYNQESRGGKEFSQFKTEGRGAKKPFFPSREFRDDPRVPDIDKMKPSKTEKVPNRGMFYPDKKNGLYYEDPVSGADPMLDARDFEKDDWINRHYRSNNDRSRPSDTDNTNDENNDYCGTTTEGSQRTNEYTTNEYIFDDDMIRDTDYGARQEARELEKAKSVLDRRNRYNSTFPVDSQYERNDSAPVPGSYHVDPKRATGFSLDETRFEPRGDPHIDPGYEKHNKFTSQYRINPDPRYNYIIADLDDPVNNDNRASSNNKYSKYQQEYDSVTKPMKRTTNDIPFNDSKYGDTIKEPSFDEWWNKDQESMSSPPPLGNSKARRDLSTADYRMNTFIGQERGVIDSDIEGAMIRGMPSNTKKSYGYRNPAEHYYQYIDKDFQTPDRTDLGAGVRGGFSTRRDNVAQANQRYSRDVM